MIDGKGSGGSVVGAEVLPSPGGLRATRLGTEESSASSNLLNKDQLKKLLGNRNASGLTKACDTRGKGAMVGVSLKNEQTGSAMASIGCSAQRTWRDLPRNP